MEFAKRFSIAVRCLIAYNVVYWIAIHPDSQTTAKNIADFQEKQMKYGEL